MCFAGLYVIASATCAGMAFSTNDFKGRFVLLQAPIVLQSALLPEPVLRMLEGVSWPLAYLLLGLPVVAGLYVFGALVGSAASEAERENAETMMDPSKAGP